MCKLSLVSVHVVEFHAFYIPPVHSLFYALALFTLTNQTLYNVFCLKTSAPHKCHSLFNLRLELDQNYCLVFFCQSLNRCTEVKKNKTGWRYHHSLKNKIIAFEINRINAKFSKLYFSVLLAEVSIVLQICVSHFNYKQGRGLNGKIAAGNVDKTQGDTKNKEITSAETDEALWLNATFWLRRHESTLSEPN